MIPLWKFQAFDRSIMVRSQLIWLCPILNTLKHNSSNKSLKIHKVGLSYRVFFSKGPTQKSSKYGIGPTQQDKMAKYTGPTHSYKMSELLTNTFCC